MTTSLTLDLIREVNDVETIYEVECELSIQKASPSYVATENAVPEESDFDVIAVYLNDKRVEGFQVTTEEIATLHERAAETVRDAEEMEESEDDE